MNKSLELSNKHDKSGSGLTIEKESKENNPVLSKLFKLIMNGLENINKAAKLPDGEYLDKVTH